MEEQWRLNGFFSIAQLKRWRDQIPRRYSCRAFAQAPNVSQWTTLSYAAARVCLPGVRILLAACDESFFTPMFLSYGRITGAVRFAAIIADTSVPRHLTHAGISGEAFVLEAASAGINTCWVTGTYRKKESPVVLSPGEVLAAVIPLGVGVQPEGAAAGKRRKSLGRITAGRLAGWPEYALDAAKAVQEAPSDKNRQPWKLRFGTGSLSLIGKPNSLDIGIALLHMEAALEEHPRHWVLDAGGKAPAARVRLIRT